MARKEQPDESPEQLRLFFASRYLTIGQIAEIMGVPKSFIYRRTARGHDDPIPHYRLGGHLRFKLEDVEEWIEKHRSKPAAPSPAALVAAMRRNSQSRSTKSLRNAEPLGDHP